MIKIYNSLTNKIEEFKPIKDGEISMYVCGPTVYDKLHIGNSRPVIFFDTVARFFRFMGYKVKYISNFTDIDDKIINKAIKEKVTEKQISEKYIGETLALYHRLGCLPHTANPRVTETIPEIIAFIGKMLEEGCAYKAGEDICFDISKCPEYGILSGQTLDKLLTGVRIDTNDNKRHPFDFTLWKKTDKGVKWNAPWGDGRPGWHTECVVMIDKAFHGKIDIHGGGNDLKFPHHDNEIAQSLCVHKHKIASYWIHNGRVDLAGEKMSKSLGNVLWADELLNRLPTPVYRLMMLNVPYRQLLSYREELAGGAKTDYEKIRGTYMSCYRKLELAGIKIPEAEYAVSFSDPEIGKTAEEFTASMSSDFNTANALTAVFKLTKLLNGFLRERNPRWEKLSESLLALKSMLWVFGIIIDVDPLTDADRKMLDAWKEAKARKDFETADKLRGILKKRDIAL